MKQPELGNKISEIRNQKGITQKELSESCNVDIRTIQRIESGDVVPRMSTLRLIAVTLKCDLNTFNGNSQNKDTSYLSKILIFSFVAGIIYFVNFIFYFRLIPGINIWFYGNFYLAFSIIHVFAGVLFYYGLFELSKSQQNRLLQIALIISIICFPLFLITNLVGEGYVHHLNQLIVIILGFNGFIFGAGLMKAKSQFIMLYKIAGILQFILSPMFIVPVPVIQWIGLWLAIPFILFLLIIVFIEYRESKLTNQYAET